MDDDLLPKERAFLLGWAFGKGQKLTTSDVAESYGIQRRSAARLLNELSRKGPIIRDLDGRWQDVELIMVGSGDDVTE